MLNQRFEKHVIQYSIATRIIFTLFSCVTRYLLPPHDPEVFVSPIALFSGQSTPYDKIISFVLGGLTHWDAQHFYHISQGSYIYEQSLAFFPLYPFILAVLSAALSVITGNALNVYSRLILVSYVFNSVCFVFTCLALLRLSKIILKNDVMALKSTMLFCVSPASVFFLASYSESLFSLLTFWGMLKYARGSLFQSVLLFSLATACRSNGLLNVGYILHYYSYTVSTYKLFSFKFFKYIYVSFLYSCIVICPYFLFQLFSYYLYCLGYELIKLPQDLVSFGVERGFKLPLDSIAWCNQTLPFSYPYVQNHYWNVGFLSYYSIRQIPNFLLVIPITLIIIPYSIIFLKYYRHLLVHIKLIYNPNLKYFVKPPPYINYLLPRSTFVFNAHALVLIIFCLLNINVQVTTRIMCSSSPLLYWLAALYFKKPIIPNKLSWKIFSYSVLGLEPLSYPGSLFRMYFLGYTIIGITLFSCNYPWT